jgi:hypothetical protein
VLERYRLEDIQHLKGDHLAAAQHLTGHGNRLGRWETPSARSKCEQSIDIAKRIRDAVDKLDPERKRNAHAVDEQIIEAVLALTRVALLMRTAPVGGSNHKAKNQSPLKGPTVAKTMYDRFPNIMARALLRKDAEESHDAGFFCHLTTDDVATLSEDDFNDREIRRLLTLADLGLWSDIPKREVLQKVTSTSSKPKKTKPQHKSAPHPPLSMQWLSETGPRVLWVVNELSPNLLRLLEQLSDLMKGWDAWTLGEQSRREKIQTIIAERIARDPWLDSAGRPLVPPFCLKTAANFRADNFEWPIRNWEHVVSLSTLVQTAHGFIALLATAGRIGEVRTLKRSCVELHADGSAHARGKTYKLNWSPQGMSRTWPVPEILAKAIGQQAQLAAAWDMLPLGLNVNGAPTEPHFGEQLWISIGTNGKVGPGADLDWQSALESLATRLGVDPKPGGKNVHPHRFRKTVAMLAGVALWNSPLVLKQLLGHKAIEMTLQYILSDPGIREEAEKVLRELRVMHCADTFDQVREAVKAGLPSPFGGNGGARLVVAVTEFENREEHSGRVVTKESLMELATQYTMNGRAWRLGWGFICSKLPHEGGECQTGASRRGEHGEPLISNCKNTCTHRIDLATQIHQAREKRDVEANCELYVRTAKEACKGGQLLVANDCLRQMYELLGEWPDLKAQFDARSDVKAIAAALMEEPEFEMETAHG